MTQHTTETMLALGLQDHMIGTSAMDDRILPEYETAYNLIPVLGEFPYPSREVILSVEPDFIYGGFASVFRDDAAGPQEDLKDLGINSFLTSGVCKSEADTMDDVYADILDLGSIFGVSQRAEELVASMKTEIIAATEGVHGQDRPLRVFHYDSGADAPYTAACCGLTTNLIAVAGGENIFNDIDGRFQTVNWEEVIARDPEVIVLGEAAWSTADEKRELLLNNPALAGITAVKDQRFVVLQFSSTVPGVRNPTAIKQLAAGFFPK